MLVLISLTALAGATGAAQAGNCPRGQIYQVSKHVCVDRAEAVKLGIVNGSAPEAETARPAPEIAPDAEAAPAPEPAPRAKPARKIAPPSIAHPKRPARDPETPKAVVQDPPAHYPAAQDPSAQNPPAQVPPAEAPKPAVTQNPFGVLDPNNVPALAPVR